MTIPKTADEVNNISDLFYLFENKWPEPKRIIFRGESMQFPNFMCPSAFRDGYPANELSSYKIFYENYQGSSHRDQMFDKLHSNATPTSLPTIALAQHYGTKTRFLDVTLNPLVALYFAASDHPDHDGFVFFFIENIIDLTQYPDFKDLESIIESDQVGDYRPHADTILYFRPRWPNTRIAAQNGAFIFTKGFSQCLWKGGGVYRIPAKRKTIVLEQLKRFSMTHDYLLPGLEGT